MDYKLYEYENYSIHTVNTKKFKSIVVILTFLNEFDRDNLSKNALLRKLLTSSNKFIKNESEMIRKQYDLYNSSLAIGNESYNNSILTIFDIEFLEDKYTEDGLAKKVIDHFYNCIYNPNIIDGKFEPQNYEFALKSLNLFYDVQKENKNAYSICRAHELLDEQQLKYFPNGYKEDLKNITNEDMVKFYNKILSEGSVNFFVIGNLEDYDIVSLINERFKDKIKKNKSIYKPLTFKDIPSIQEKIEKEENNQSKLVMIYKILNMTDRERNVIMPIFNRIFGVGNNSKLFKNVREKNSLAYDIRSISQRDESLITVLAGISKESKDETVKIVNEELSKIQNGEFDDKDLEEALKYRKIILKSFVDDNYSIIMTKMGKVLFSNDDLDERINNLSTVKKEEIISFANKLNLNIVYMLEGDRKDEEN